MSDETINAGNLVVLKCGSPMMAVGSLRDKYTAICHWYAGEGNGRGFEAQIIPLRALRSATDDEIKVFRRDLWF